MAIEPAELMKFKRVFIGPDHHEYTVQSFRAYQNNWLLKLDGVDTRNDAELLQGRSVSIKRQDRPAPADAEYFTNQIIGLAVETIDGVVLGQITEILKTGANDVYVVKNERREILLPAQDEVIREIDVEHGKMIVKLLPGL